MMSTKIHGALQEAVHEVLETMFFVRELEDRPGDGSETPPDLAAALEFEGKPSGRLTLTLAGHAARAVAADFLGAEEDELSDLQVEEVACELANMVCGSVLSRTESDTRFRLAAPQILRVPTLVFPPEEAVLSVGLDHGALTVHLVLWADSGAAAAGAAGSCPEPALG